MSNQNFSIILDLTTEKTGEATNSQDQESEKHVLEAVISRFFFFWLRDGHFLVSEKTPDWFDHLSPKFSIQAEKTGQRHDVTHKSTEEIDHIEGR